MSNKAYAQAGVDIALGDSVKDRLKTQLARATRPEVIGGLGGFGGLFDLSQHGLEKPVLVASTDGVGTKLKLAFTTGRHRGIGHDIVNHCINDLAVCGAQPLFFLDYFASGKLEPAVFHELLEGMAEACADAGCALLGGETAQMPGFYRDGEYDVCGTIVGIVERAGAGPSVVLWILHHLVVDGISWRILLEDLNVLASQLLDGQPLVLPEKTVPSGHWVEALRRHADSPQGRSELPYWLRLAEGASGGDISTMSTAAPLTRLSRCRSGPKYSSMSGHISRCEGSMPGAPQVSSFLQASR